jgi:amyloid beta precursor protein binding protein 1
VDTHPSPETTDDLRLLKPWPELLEYAAEKTTNLEAMAEDDHGHVPYIALLLHYLEEWKKEHDGQVPTTYKDMTAFRTNVSKAARTNNPEGGEENYDEAVAAAFKSLNSPEPSSAVKEIFRAPECILVTQQSASFWVIAHAIGLFYTKYGVLPVPGAVPDMKARSADYIQLQNIYKSKARKDMAEVLDSVRFLERNTNRSTPIKEKDVEAFCKNAAHIKLVRGRPFQVVKANDSLKWGDMAKSIGRKTFQAHRCIHADSNTAETLTFPDSLIPIYVAFLAWDKFIATHDKDALGGAPKIPGQSDADVATDAEKVTGIAFKITDDLVKEASASIEEDEYAAVKSQIAESVQELVRAGGAELHNISALSGGMVSQEVIKVITEQYVPVDNTCIFDGVRSKTMVIQV